MSEDDWIDNPYANFRQVPEGVNCDDIIDFIDDKGEVTLGVLAVLMFMSPGVIVHKYRVRRTRGVSIH